MDDRPDWALVLGCLPVPAEAPTLLVVRREDDDGRGRREPEPALVERSDGVPSRRPRRGEEEKLELLLLVESLRFRPTPLRRDPSVVGDVERLGSLDKDDEDPPRRPDAHDPATERLDDIPSRRPRRDVEV